MAMIGLSQVQVRGQMTALASNSILYARRAYRERCELGTLGVTRLRATQNYEMPSRLRLGHSMSMI